MTLSEFRVVFQPIVNMRSRRTVGWEALARFTNDNDPARVIADAWDSGIGEVLEQSIVRDAIDKSEKLLAGGDTFLSVNMTGDAIAADVLRRANDVDPADMVVEVTEHTRPDVLANYRALRTFLQRGGRLAVDDVGSGYSGLLHIAQASPDIIKIDKMLVSHIDENAAKRAVILGIVATARALRCRVIAEGVEREAEREWLLAVGILYGQGFLFGRPAPASEWTDNGTDDGP